ncbi:hypothetical protein LSAT2_028791 [Lamellibrachia satsuma]|nr:hypothetical protein LSAT2_028791 [Lamellibrachia satsuma]
MLSDTCGRRRFHLLQVGPDVLSTSTDNSHGQIGSDCAEALVAKSVDTLSHVTFIACGSHHCLAINGKHWGQITMC